MARKCRREGCDGQRVEPRVYCSGCAPKPGEPNYKCDRRLYLDTGPMERVVRGSHRPISVALPPSLCKQFYHSLKRGKVNDNVADRILEFYGTSVDETYAEF